jgi:hypothetical protein
MDGYPKQVSTRNGRVSEIGGHEKQAGARKGTRNKQVRDKGWCPTRSKGVPETDGATKFRRAGLKSKVGARFRSN